eukprot:scaffold234_cov406-Prasinococcus_capsulatus_cf.AAC.5
MGLVAVQVMFCMQIALSSYLVTQLLLVVNPMLGRTGSFKEVEIVLSILCAVGTWLTLPALSLSLVHSSPRSLHRALPLVLVTLSLGALLLSPRATKYSDRFPKRQILQHVQRQVYSENQSLLYDDSMVWAVSLGTAEAIA